jgi:hypothetical protein
LVQRRWIRLTFAGWCRMTGIRRELPRSSVAGRPVGCRIGEARVLLLGGTAHQPTLEPVSSGCPQWLLSGDCPHEPGELAGARDDDLLVRLAAAAHPLPPSMQSLLAAPRALEDLRVLAALAARELIADRRAATPVPGRLDE